MSSPCLRGLRPGCPGRPDRAVRVSMPFPVSGETSARPTSPSRRSASVPSCTPPTVGRWVGSAAPRVAPPALEDGGPVVRLQPSARFEDRLRRLPPRDACPALPRPPVSALGAPPRVGETSDPTNPCGPPGFGASRRLPPAAASGCGLRVVCDHPVSGCGRHACLDAPLRGPSTSACLALSGPGAHRSHRLGKARARVARLRCSASPPRGVARSASGRPCTAARPSCPSGLPSGRAAHGARSAG